MLKSIHFGLKKKRRVAFHSKLVFEKQIISSWAVEQLTWQTS